jgi:hypothetical protein
MTSVVWMRNVCHCEEDSMDDAAIHRVSRRADGFAVRFLAQVDRHGLRPRDDKGGVCGSVTEGQWIATGFALAMTRVVGFVMTEGTFRAYFSLFTFQTSLFLHWLF